MKVETAKTRKAQCGPCGGVRNCDVHGHLRKSGEDGLYSWATDWYLLQCRGCEHVFVLTIATNSEEYYNDQLPNGDWDTVYLEDEKYWPALNSRKRPDWYPNLWLYSDKASELEAALSELYVALQNDLNVLAGIGIRTCFDIASEALGIDTGLSFEQKLKRLEAGGHISKRDLPRISMLVEAGSASAHRGWRPKKGDLDVMMDVLEHFISESIVAPFHREHLDQRAEVIASGVPKRQQLASRRSDVKQDPANPHTSGPEAPRTDPA